MQQVTEYHFEGKTRKMHGVKRVLVFCIMIVILPAILIIMPLYMRKTIFADVIYPVAESDIIEIRDGISSIFCSKHTLRMNSHFNAFQLRNKPEISTNRKHIRLKKSMTLPDDTLEYWGFFLLKGARVSLKFCSRYNGSRLLVIKGKRELKLCGLTDHNKNKLGANYAQGHEQVKVFFEDVVEITEEKLPVDGLLEHENHGGEDLSDDRLPANVSLKPTPVPTPAKRLQKKLKKGTTHPLPKSMESLDPTVHNESSNASSYRTRRQTAHERGKRQLYEQLYKRKERQKRENVYDRKYSHGGNAVNFTETDESNSISSFETGLFECFNGAILLAEGFPPKPACMNAHFLEKGKHDTVKHNITEDGYYYYIFYSDNDLVRNDIHAIFDIYKPTFQYSNLSESRGCLNSTDCSFNIGFLSDEIVVVEVPTRDGIEHEDDDITNLISTCHPRSEIYALFPITVLVLILCCSFL
ncbi:hypothetical protein AWZ03_013227 [Drosophila navojoa]|uniref:E3 ubiquitin-protein ligase APD1-4 middle domain-containing protein n=1 Tax=Drosophila navojoa TaxID=7232 RepID=A0A484AUR1_DRONA|nr:uncharacterized protein LOC115564754 isoform X2 [Drosophila navojoa]TDG40349.1 hypothetical protein AWZ03_013227 [Drosophila navojoa]